MYAKLFKSIVNSSIWSEDPATCKVWITLLAMRDRFGCIYGSVLGISRLSSLAVEVVESALKKFMEPDKYSSDRTRSPENQGRRIEIVPGGWKLLNFAYYEHIGNSENRKEQIKQAVQRYRLKKSTKPPKDVIKCNQRGLHVIGNHRRDGDGDGDGSKKEICRKPPSAASDLVVVLVDLWNAGRKPTEVIRVTPLRKAKVASRLKDGFTPEQLIAIVTLLRDSEWHQGANERGWKVSGPEWVLHSTERAEQWRAKLIHPASEAALHQGSSEPCKRCEGRGLVQTQATNPFTDKAASAMMSCEACGGKGQLPA